MYYLCISRFERLQGKDMKDVVNMNLDDIMKDFDGSEGDMSSEQTTEEISEYSDLRENDQYSAVEGLTTDLHKRTFNEIIDFTRESQPIFDNPSYYKMVLQGEGDEAVRLHDVLTKMFKSTDPSEKIELKNRIIPIYWDLHAQLVLRSLSHSTSSHPKHLTVRYGAILPSLLSKDHRQVLSQIIWDNNLGEAVWYCDEWVKMVAEGTVNALATDEEASTRKGDPASEIARLRGNLSKVMGMKDAIVNFIKKLEQERQDLMQRFKFLSDILVEEHISHRLENVHLPFNDDQKNAISQISGVMKSFTSLGKHIDLNYNKYVQILEDISKIESELEQLSQGNPVIDNSIGQKEATKIAVLAKMCVGARGNHYPILASQFFRASIDTIATRENVVKMMDEVEKIDVGIFRREFRRQINRIPPHAIIIPCYGSRGVCWEPYERNNKATSRGRIAIPMFPADLRVAVITALADLRWQQAKEMAAHYWMEEGLTGSFFQWFSAQKLRGDVRLTFIENYILWITKESEGMQKLDREVRGIFWRTIPFSLERREILKDRGFVYNQLYLNDKNRAGAFDSVYPS